MSPQGSYVALPQVANAGRANALPSDQTLNKDLGGEGFSWNGDGKQGTKSTVPLWLQPKRARGRPDAATLLVKEPACHTRPATVSITSLANGDGDPGLIPAMSQLAAASNELGAEQSLLGHDLNRLGAWSAGAHSAQRALAEQVQVLQVQADQAKARSQRLQAQVQALAEQLACARAEVSGPPRHTHLVPHSCATAPAFPSSPRELTSPPAAAGRDWPRAMTAGLLLGDMRRGGGRHSRSQSPSHQDHIPAALKPRAASPPLKRRTSGPHPTLAMPHAHAAAQAKPDTRPPKEQSSDLLQGRPPGTQHSSVSQVAEPSGRAGSPTRRQSPRRHGGVSPLRLPFHANMPAPLAEEHAALASLQQLQQQLEELLADVQSRAAATRSDLVAQMEASHQAALANHQHMADLQAEKAAAAALMKELDTQRMDAASHTLTLLTWGATAGGTSARTKAVIEAAATEARRQGRYLAALGGGGGQQGGGAPPRRLSRGAIRADVSPSGAHSRSTGPSPNPTSGTPLPPVSLRGAAINAVTATRPRTSSLSGAAHTHRGSPLTFTSPVAAAPPAPSSSSSSLLAEELQGASDLESLAPIQRLLRLHHLSARFSRAGTLAAHLHRVMSSCHHLHDLAQPQVALQHLVQMMCDMTLAEQVVVYRVLGSHYWALVSQGAPGIVAALGDGSPLLRPVERGTVSFVAQSVTPLHTAQLRTVFAYSHAHEDIQVPHTPATPALLVPVRDEAAPAYPVPGLLPSKAVVKLVGKRRAGPSDAHMKHLQFTQADVAIVRVLASGLGHALSSWDVWEAAAARVRRRQRLLEASRAIMSQQDPLQLIYDLVDLAANTVYAQQAVLYIVDRGFTELVGHMVIKPESQRLQQQHSQMEEDEGEARRKYRRHTDGPRQPAPVGRLSSRSRSHSTSSQARFTLPEQFDSPGEPPGVVTEGDSAALGDTMPPVRTVSELEREQEQEEEEGEAGVEDMSEEGEQEEEGAGAAPAPPALSGPPEAAAASPQEPSSGSGAGNQAGGLGAQAHDGNQAGSKHVHTTHTYAAASGEVKPRQGEGSSSSGMSAAGPRPTAVNPAAAAARAAAPAAGSSGQKPKVEHIRFKRPIAGILGQAYTQAETVNLEGGVAGGPGESFSPAVDIPPRMTSAPRSMMVVPIRTSPGSHKLLGLLQVINRLPCRATPLRPSQAQAARFTQEDEHLLNSVADMVAASAHFVTHLTSTLDKHASGGLTPSYLNSSGASSVLQVAPAGGSSNPAAAGGGGGGGGSTTPGGAAGGGSDGTDPGSSSGSLPVSALLLAAARAVPGGAALAAAEVCLGVPHLAEAARRLGVLVKEAVQCENVRIFMVRSPEGAGAGPGPRAGSLSGVMPTSARRGGRGVRGSEGGDMRQSSTSGAAPEPSSSWGVRGLLQVALSATESHYYPLNAGIAGLAARTARPQMFSGSRMLTSELRSQRRIQENFRLSLRLELAQAARASDMGISPRELRQDSRSERHMTEALRAAEASSISGSGSASEPAFLQDKRREGRPTRSSHMGGAMPTVEEDDSPHPSGRSTDSGLPGAGGSSSARNKSRSQSKRVSHIGFGDEALFDEVEPTESAQYDAAVDGAGLSPWCCLALPLCEPMTREVVAVIEALNKRRGRFTSSDVRALKAISSKASIVFINAEAAAARARCTELSTSLLVQLGKLGAGQADLRRLCDLAQSQAMTLLPGCNLAALVLVNVPASQSGFQGTIDTPAGAAAGTQQDAVIGGETPQGVSGSGVLLAGGGPVALAQLFGPSPAVTPRSPALPPGTTSGSTVSSIAQQPSLAGSSLLEGGALWLPAGSMALSSSLKASLSGGASAQVSAGIAGSGVGGSSGGAERRAHASSLLEAVAAAALAVIQQGQEVVSVSGSLGRRDEYTGRSLPLRISHALPLRLPFASGGQVFGALVTERSSHQGVAIPEHDRLLARALASHMGLAVAAAWQGKVGNLPEARIATAIKAVNMSVRMRLTTLQSSMNMRSSSSSNGRGNRVSEGGSGSALSREPLGRGVLTQSASLSTRSAEAGGAGAAAPQPRLSSSGSVRQGGAWEGQVAAGQVLMSRAGREAEAAKVAAAAVAETGDSPESTASS